MAYKIIFVDSDVLLDVILNRFPYYESSADVILLADDETYKFCTSLHSILNIHYFAKKAFGEERARASIKLILNKLSIIAEEKQLLDNALESKFSDFEDAVQYFAALEAGATAIITRNTKDYKHSNIPVLTPEQFLKTL